MNYFLFLQVGKEFLIIKSKEGEDFNLLMELLRGEHWLDEIDQILIGNTNKNIKS